MSKKNEDDKQTQILNLGDLKEDLKDESDDSPEEIEFSSSESSKIDLYVLNYKNDYFHKNHDLLSKYFNIIPINKINEISPLLKDNPKLNLALFYNEPKIINALLKQLNQIFPAATTIIIASNLSQDKVAAHSSTTFSANHYFSSSSDFSDLHVLLK